MGLGFNDFTAGDTLTAAQVDGYLMRQTMMVFASTSARDTALSGNLEEGMFAYNTDANAVYYYSGSAWVPFFTPWTTFTPTITNFTIGNGSQTHFYRYTPGALWVRGFIVFGSTTTIGTTRMTLPDSQSMTTSGTGTYQQFGWVSYFDDDLSDVYSGIMRRHSDTQVAFLTSDWANLTSGLPFTWATSDRIDYNFMVPLDG